MLTLQSSPSRAGATHVATESVSPSPHWPPRTGLYSTACPSRRQQGRSSTSHLLEQTVDTSLAWCGMHCAPIRSRGDGWSPNVAHLRTSTAHPSVTEQG